MTFLMGWLWHRRSFAEKPTKLCFQRCFFKPAPYHLYWARASLALSWSAPHKKSAFTIIGFPFIFWWSRTLCSAAHYHAYHNVPFILLPSTGHNFKTRSSCMNQEVPSGYLIGTQKLLLFTTSWPIKNRTKSLPIKETSPIWKSKVLKKNLTISFENPMEFFHWFFCSKREKLSNKINRQCIFTQAIKGHLKSHQILIIPAVKLNGSRKTNDSILLIFVYFSSPSK